MLSSAEKLADMLCAFSPGFQGERFHYWTYFVDHTSWGLAHMEVCILDKSFVFCRAGSSPISDHLSGVREAATSKRFFGANRMATWAWVKIKPPENPQIVANVAIYQGKPFRVLILTATFRTASADKRLSVLEPAQTLPRGILQAGKGCIVPASLV